MITDLNKPTATTNTTVKRGIGRMRTEEEIKEQLKLYNGVIRTLKAKMITAETPEKKKKFSQIIDAMYNQKDTLRWVLGKRK